MLRLLFAALILALLVIFIKELKKGWRKEQKAEKLEQLHDEKEILELEKKIQVEKSLIEKKRKKLTHRD